MAAGATGATTGKAAAGATQRGSGSTIAQLVEHDHEAAAASRPAHAATAPPATPVAGASQPAKPRGSSAAGPDTADTTPGTRAARPATGTAGPASGRARPAANAQAAAPAPFAQALAQLRAAPAANAALAELAQGSQCRAAEPTGEAVPGSDLQATQEDAPDSALAQDAASAALAAVLQWLHPVTATHSGDPQGGNGGNSASGADTQDSAQDGAAAAAAIGGATGTMTATVPGLLPGASRTTIPSANNLAADLAPGTALDTQAAAVAGALPGGTVASAASQVGTTPGFESLASALRSTAALADASRSSEPPDARTDAASAGDTGGPVGAAHAATQGLDVAAAWRTGAGAAPATAERTVPVAMHDRHWPQAVAGQVLVLASQRIDTATLRLSPEHLGPVEVRIDLQGQGVNVSFGAEHAETRAALEQAMPQLREAFAGAGLTLGQATVQQHMRRESQNAQALPNASAAAADQLEVSPAVLRAIGLLDEYA
jgi:flagellar hook-length control protein FliK